MKRPKYYWRDPATGEPYVHQPDENGWQVSWNPDDGRWYIHDNNWDTVATFADRRNAVQYAHSHKAH